MKKAVQVGRLPGRSAESDLTTRGRSAASSLEVAVEGLARKPPLGGLFQTLTAWVSMLLVVAGPVILVCAPSRGFGVLGGVLMLQLAGVAAGAIAFRFRAGQFQSHILLVSKNSPNDVHMSRAA